ncbi:hypothetical protein GCM10020258_29860 [Sphingomonas yabuuchiae]
MLAKLLNLRKRVPDFVPAMVPGLRVYAIGDIHGRLDLLDAILTRIEVDHAARPPAERHIIFLGDLVDRGPDRPESWSASASLAPAIAASTA